MSSIQVWGHRAEGVITPPEGSSLIPDLAVHDAVSVSRHRGDSATPVTIDGVQPDDVFEVVLEGGLRIWRRFDDLEAEFGTSARRGDGQGLVIPPTLQIGRASRGVGETLAIESVRRLGFAKRAAHGVGKALEARLEREPGLYQWRGPQGLGEEAAKDLPTNRPILLFLHGTMSSTRGSFGGLEAAWSKLAEVYGDHVYGFEHRSLTESPIDNAVALVRELPEDARLHVVSHSRGGLIGELLSRYLRVDGRPIDDIDLGLFAPEGAEAGREKDLAALRELAQLMERRRPRVEAFVRVACPAAGTTLASRRLDRYLGIIVNLIGLIPQLKATPLYDLITGFLLAVVKERTKPETLPGLEAQMPESPLIAMLNRPDVSIAGDLSVVAGDIEPRGVFRRLAILATDAFFREDHDLVVNTVAMLGGLRRSGSSRLDFAKGSHVNHFGYFTNADTGGAVLDALRGRYEQFTDLGAARGEEALRAARPRSISRRDGRPAPTVFVVPGLMGSHLEVGGDRVWLDMVDLALGGMERLGRDAPDVKPLSVIDRVYGDLSEFLSTTHHVEQFPYDWRRSLLHAGDELGEAVARVLEQSSEPVRIVAHSMGGLVTLAMIHRHPEVWEAFAARPGRRLVLMGSPMRGSFVIPLVLLGREKAVRKLALLDLKHSRERLLTIVSRFQGLLDLLPDAEDNGLFDPTFWKRLHDLSGGWTRPVAEDLAEALRTRALLAGSSFDPVEVVYVAGSAPATPVGYKLDPDATGEERVRFLASSRGDGRVPWDTGPPAGATIFYVDATHGDIPAHEAAFRGYQELLDEGDTSRLSRLPPVRRGEPGEVFELPEAPIDIFPDEADLAAAVVGSERRLEATAKPLALNVRVAHGNLAYASHAVAVGHYEKDLIVSAEDELDRHLDGALRRRFALGTYPGSLNTSAVVFPPSPTRRPAGALVVGLGRVGQLSPGALRSTFANGLLQYATACLERHGAAEPKAAQISVTSLLIGTGEGGLGLGAALEALLKGVADANRALTENIPSRPQLISEVEFLELFEDRAIHALEILRSGSGTGEAVRVEPELQVRPGGLRRVFVKEDPRWWRRVEIRGAADGEDGGQGSTSDNGEGTGLVTLRFKALTDRARAEMRLVANQRSILDPLVRDSMEDPSWDPELAASLFELLLPNDFKEQAAEERSVELVLDEASAAYPWELLVDPRSPSEPPAVATGLVRRLLVPESSPAEIASGDFALVVGNPRPIPDPFPDLPAARDEARAVAEVLGRYGLAVTSSIEKPAADIVRALFGRGPAAAEGYRIIHLAGHGVLQTDGRPSGMMIGDGQVLGATEVLRLRRLPELVFINCCHLGRVEGRRHRPGVPFNRLAANLGRAFIERGVKAVVAAGWAVDDAAAAEFAGTLYTRMLEDGQAFGEAVSSARSAVYDRYGGHTNTWGAYQCYGDHAFVLRTRSRPPSPPSTSSFSSPAQALVEIGNIEARAKLASMRGHARLREQLIEATARIPGRWLGGQVHLNTAVGAAWAALGDFEEALRHLQELGSREPATHAIRSIELYANVAIRAEFTRWRAGRSTGARSLEVIGDAVTWIERLIALGNTAERLSLMGSADKRRAAIKGRAPVAGSRWVERSREWYAKAVDISPSGSVTYPLLNNLYLLAVQRWRDPTYQQSSSSRRGSASRYGHLLAKARKILTDGADDAQSGFFDCLIAAELDLIEGIWAGAVDPERFIEAFGDAWRRGGSLRSYQSVDENLTCLTSILDGAKSAPGVVSLVDDLEKTREGIAALVRRGGDEAGA